MVRTKQEALANSFALVARASCPTRTGDASLYSLPVVKCIFESQIHPTGNADRERNSPWSHALDWLIYLFSFNY
jgi:hypothetical protein